MYMPVETNTSGLSINGMRTISLAAAVASLLISMRVFLGEDLDTGLERLIKTFSPVIILAVLCKCLRPSGHLLYCPRYVACVTFAIVVSMNWPELLTMHGVLEHKKECTMAWLSTISIIATTAIHGYC